MTQYLAPFAIAFVGFLLLGPLGLIAGLVIWYLVHTK